MSRKGVVNNVFTTKGFGFILGNDNNKYFFHKSMLSNKADWRKMRVSETVEFEPVKAEKGLEAHSVALREKINNISGIDNIPGIYGAVVVKRGNYTNADMNMADSDGLTFHGYKTPGGRFPVNDKMMGLLKDMRAVFDKDNKFWFLPAYNIRKGISKIDELLREAKRIKRNKIIRNVVLLVVGGIIVWLYGAVIWEAIGNL